MFNAFGVFLTISIDFLLMQAAVTSKITWKWEPEEQA